MCCVACVSKVMCVVCVYGVVCGVYVRCCMCECHHNVTSRNKYGILNITTSKDCPHSFNHIQLMLLCMYLTSACPPCFNGVSMQFTRASELYQMLFSQLNSSLPVGVTPTLLARINQNKELLELLLERASNASMR